MEKSVKTYSGKRRMMTPAILLIAGLLCISWLGVNRDNGSRQDPLLTADQDTVIRKNEKSARYSRRTITTQDENGQPHEQVVEEFEGDEDLRPWVSVAPVPNIRIPAAPPFPVPPVAPILPHMDFEAFSDTIPPFVFNFTNAGDWEYVAKDFEEHFRTKFENFQPLATNEFPELLEGFELNIESNEWQTLLKDFHFQTEVLAENLEQLEVLKNLELDHLQILHEPDHGNSRKYLDALREQLIKDGYLAATGNIETIEVTDDFIKINGIGIRKEHEQKYDELQQKYFPRTKLQKFELPPPKGSVKMISADNVGELVTLLKNEAKVL